MVRSMIGWRVVLALLVGLAAVGPAAAEVRLDSNHWLRVDCVDFTIYSNAGERRTRELSRELEQLSAALDSSILPQRPFGRPTRIFVFRSSASFDSYRDVLLGRGSDKDGIYFSRPSGNFIIIDGGARGSRRVALHEMTHKIVHGSLGFVPLWVNEGLAGMFETFQLDGRRARAGRVERSDLQMLRTKRIPVAEILNMSARSEDFLSGPRSRLVYAQTRLMVHYLLLGNPSRAERLPLYLELLRERTDPVEAFERAFEVTLHEFESELFAYAHRKIYPMLTLKPQRTVATRSHARPMTSSEVLAELAGLLAEGGSLSLPAAESLVRASLEHDPSNERAHTVLGLVHQRQGKLEASLAAYEAALELGSADPILIARAARVALRLSTGGPAHHRQERFERAASLFRRSVELSPHDAGHWSALGIALARSEATRGEARAALETALRIDPEHRAASRWLDRLGRTPDGKSGSD